MLGERLSAKMGDFRRAPRTDSSFMPTFRKPGLVSLIALGTLAALAPATARATYSIVAADRATRQVGGAVTSCVAPSSVAGVYGSAPGRGAVASQAASNRAGRDRAVQLLLMDAPPNRSSARSPRPRSTRALRGGNTASST